VILRILEEGQYEVTDELVTELNALDEEIVAAIESGDEARFESALEALLARVREGGGPVPDDFLGASELVLPGPGYSLAEVRSMLGEEGLIPG
jgi:hypothetical protein